MMSKSRLDALLAERGLTESREQAKRLILAGLVFVNEQKIDKAGTMVADNAEIRVTGQEHPYAGRGGLKLEKALREFQLIHPEKLRLMSARPPAALRIASCSAARKRCMRWMSATANWRGNW